MAVFGAVFSVGFFAGDETGTASLIVGPVPLRLAIAIVTFLYAPVMMARTNGKTLGRMAIGIRVVRANGRAGDVRLRDAARGRGQGAALRHRAARSPFGLVDLLDVLWPLWDDENRALHDFVVNSRVVQD